MIRRLAPGRRNQELAPLDRGDARGLPWNPATPLYHATVALGAIKQGGFKTRRQLEKERFGGVLEATGGGTSHMLSFTTDSRVALAIVAGLETFRRIAQGELNGQDLLDQLAREVGLPTVKRAVGHEAGCGDDAACQEKHYQALRQHMWPRRGDTFELPRLDELPPGSRVTSWWHETLGQTREQWEASTYVDRETGRTMHRVAKVHTWDEPLRGEALAQKLINVYRVSVGLSERVYNPVFFGTDARAFAKVRRRSIGIIEATSSYRRICPDGPHAALALGVVDLEQARGQQSFLQSWGYDCSRLASPDPFGRDRGEGKARSLRDMGGWTTPDRVGPIPMERDIPYTIGPDTSMVALGSLQEVRLARPEKLKLGRFLSYDGLVRMGLLKPEQLTYPNFREEPSRELPSPQRRSR